MMDNSNKKPYNKEKSRKSSKKGTGVLKLATATSVSTSTKKETETKKLSWAEVQKMLTVKNAFGRGPLDSYRER